MKGDGRWLRGKVRDMLSAAQAPDFAVISIGGNALAKRARPGEPLEMRDDVMDMISLSENELRKIMDLLDLCQDLKVILLGVIPRAGLTPEGLNAFQALSEKIRLVADEYGQQYVDVTELLKQAKDVDGSIEIFMTDNVHLTEKGMSLIWDEIIRITMAAWKKTPKGPKK